MAALAVRTNMLWPVMVLHGMRDLFLQLSYFPPALMDTIYDIVVLVYGVFLLWSGAHSRASRMPPAVR